MHIDDHAREDVVEHLKVFVRGMAEIVFSTMKIHPVANCIPYSCDTFHARSPHNFGNHFMQN